MGAALAAIALGVIAIVTGSARSSSSATRAPRPLPRPRPAPRPAPKITANSRRAALYALVAKAAKDGKPARAVLEEIRQLATYRSGAITNADVLGAFREAFRPAPLPDWLYAELGYAKV